jgi:hypothetical protein
MSGKLKVVEIATKALEKIGAFTANMTAPDPDELRRAIEWLDITVAHVAGTNRLFFLTPVTVTSTLTAATSSYVLSTLMGVNFPATGMAFPVEAYLRDSSGNDEPLELINRAEYEEIEDKTTSGPPEKVYIDRLSANQNIYVYPVPSDGTYSLRLVFQSYPATLTGGTVAGAGNLDHGFTQEWQLYLIMSLAATIGSGPVRTLPSAETARMEQIAGAAFARLMIYGNTQKTSTSQRTKGAF